MMNYFKVLLSGIVIVCVFLAHQPDASAAPTPVEELSVTTQAVTDVQEKSAVGHGSIDNISKYQFFWPKQHGLCWNTSGSPNIDDDPKTELGEVEDEPTVFTSTIKNLSPGTTYYVRAYATLPFYGTVYGNLVSFKTLKEPTITTQAVTGIGSTSATGHGAISELGHPAPVQHGICWDTKRDPTIKDQKTEEGAATETGEFSSRMTGLKMDTKYYVRAYATNALGTVYGKQTDFTTQSGRPVITTQAVTNISTAAATTNATLVDAGIPTATQHGVCWNTIGTPSFSATGCIDRGKAVAEGSFIERLTGLEPGTTYHVRAFASNEAGVYSYGQEVTFTTYKLPEVATQSVNSINTNDVNAEGEIMEPGIPAITDHGVCWNREGSPGIGDDPDCVKLGPAGDTGNFVAQIQDLLPGTTYFVRTFATNAAGTVYGGQLSFTTIDEASAPRAVIERPPAALSRQTVYQLKISGNRVVQYRYSLDGDPWSNPLDAGMELSFEISEEGPHWLLVLGQDEAGIWQPRQNATVATWTLDMTPPTIELANAPAGKIGPFPSDILVQGNDVSAYRYRLDDGQWSSLHPISMPISLPALPEGFHLLAVVGADRAGNWQDTDNATEAAWVVDAGVPTAMLTDLPAVVTNEQSISIGVTAPDGGIGVAEYYYKFADDTSWFYGKAQEPIALNGLSEGEYTLCVNAGDGQGAWQDGDNGQTSLESATCYTWRVDLTPADPVHLLAEKAPPAQIPGGPAVASRALQLSWAWDSDDEQEAIQRYRVWLAEFEITEDNLLDAPELFYASRPGAAGFVETWVVSGLTVGRTYYAAIKSIDMAGNLSDLSNVAVVTLGGSEPEIQSLAIRGQGGLQVDNGALAELIVSGSNFAGSAGNDLVRLENQETGLEFISGPGTGEQLSATIPLGTPTGVYRVRILNGRGISSPSSQTITIVDAAIPMPSVRSVSPPIAATGTRTTITVTGDHFDTAARVNLLSPTGIPTSLTDVTVQGADTITALVDVPADFPEGRYSIQVVNSETAFNQVSAARLELVAPMDLAESSGMVDTEKIIRMGDGIVPVNTVLATRDDPVAGLSWDNRLRMNVFLQPGFTFEAPIQGWDQQAPYSGILLPPRQVPPIAGAASDELGVGSVHLTMGASAPVYLKNDAAMFVSLDVTLPEHMTDPVVYYIDPEGGSMPAGVDGSWQGLDIETGGSVLAARHGVPEEGMTTYTVGLLLQHMSDYAIGSQASSGSSSDAYGPCLVTSTQPESGYPGPWSYGTFLLLIALIMAMLIRRKRNTKLKRP